MFQSVALQVLADLKRVLKEDAGLELNLSKTNVLPKGVPRVSPNRLLSMRRTTSSMPAPPSLTLARMFSSLLSVLKVLLVSECLLVLMRLYATL